MPSYINGDDDFNTDNVLWDLGHNFSETGYQKLSNGLIIQWGKIYVLANTSTIVTFPIAFPVKCFTGYATISSNVNSALAPCFTGQTKTSVSIKNTFTSAVNINWLAIGY